MGIGTALSSIISIFFIINILLHQQFFLLQRRRRPSADLPKWCGHPVLVSLQNSGWKWKYNIPRQEPCLHSSPDRRSSPTHEILNRHSAIFLTVILLLPASLPAEIREKYFRMQIGRAHV